MNEIDPRALELVTGGGRKDAAFCAMTRQAGMQFGNRVVGGKVADALPGFLDGMKPGLAEGAGGFVAPFVQGKVKATVDAAMPAFCK